MMTTGLALPQRLQCTGATVAILLGAIASGCMAVSAPLALYVFSLAALGLPHVIVEMRYVRDRFGARVRPRLAIAFAAILLLLVASRLGGIAGWPDSSFRRVFELLLQSAIVVAVWPWLASRRMPRLLSFAFAGSVTAGAVFAPLETLIVLAIAHNLTPVGFLAEALRGSDRRKVLFLASIIFGVIPIAVFVAASAMATEAAAFVEQSLPLFGATTIAEHFGAFVAPRWQDGAIAIPLFSMAAYLQVAHYFTVLHVLPCLVRGEQRSNRADRRFNAWTLAVGSAMTVVFLISWSDARAWYGIAAAVHAWIEWPVLLLGFEALPRSAVDEVDGHALIENV